MKNTRVFAGALLISTLCIWSAGCKKEGATPSSEAASAAEGSAEASATAGLPVKVLQPWTGDFDGMVERRVVRVLVVPSKTYYYVENGQPRGSTYEAFTTFQDDLNKKLGKKHVKVHVLFVPTSRDQLVPALLAGRGDVAAAALTITPERQKQVEFTRPVWSGVNKVAVTGPGSPALAKLDDLAGQEVFVRRSSSSWELVEALSKRFEAEGKKPVTLKAAPEELEDEDLLEMLNAGLFPITVTDDLVAKLWAQVYPQIRPHPEFPVATDGEIAWMIRPGSPGLKGELDAFIATHGKGTTFGNTIIKRYLGSPAFVMRSTSPAELKKFEQLVGLFRKYSGQYDVDYLLAMAQGYQESRLDQSVKSPVGAIGVMQLMPATAKELATGDPKKVEPNVHGGVKYMRFMIDRYYKDEPMTPVNKALFTFASYNAGPARVRKLRQEASERGLDPNLWFNNVEIVAADRIGPETVTYVSNIYKYYIAYKLVAEKEEAKKAAKAALAGS